MALPTFVQHVLELRKAAEPWIRQITNNLPESDLFVMVVLSDRDRDSPEVALQLGTALMQGIPLFVFAAVGVQLAPAIQRNAIAIERCDPDDPASRDAAFARLREHMKGHGRHTH